MALTAMPTFPAIGDANFNSLAYAWAVSMAGTRTIELNALEANVVSKESSASASASTATTQAGNASSSATAANNSAIAAAASAASAVNAPGTNATSSTSLNIALGSQSLTITTGKAFVVGQSVKIANTASPTNWMLGDITSHNSGTGALVVNVTLVQGSGSGITNWTIALSGPAGSGTLSTLSAATGSKTLANGNNPQVWNWAQSTANQVAFTYGESSASTGGSGSQVLLKIGTLASSTADPLQVQTRGVDTIRVSRTGSVTITALDGTTGSGTTGSTLSFSAGTGAASNAGGAFTLASGSGGTGAVNGDLNLNLGTNNGTAANAGKLSSNATKIALGGTIAAGVAYQTSIGYNSAGQASNAATGAGAMALGGSYASGTDSFAAAIGNNTNFCGAQGANSIAMGQQSKAVGQYGVAIGNFCNAAGAQNCFAIGSSNTVNGSQNVALGVSCTIGSVSYAVALGAGAQVQQVGKLAFGNGSAADPQYGLLVLRASTTGSTVVMSSDVNTAGANNQLIVATNQVMAFTGTLIGKQTGSANIAAYTITGTLVNNGGTVTMPTGTATLIGTDSIGLTTAPALAADNTNKGLTLTSGAKTATNIRWAATITSSELTYA